MTTLVVPGVRVEARFDVLPPLPAPSGILGAVGIVDRIPPGDSLVGVTKVSELREVFGPGVEASMPEVAMALANGVSEAVISPVAGGSPASLVLANNSDSKNAAILRCRSNGEWGNELAAEIRETRVGKDIVRVSLKLYRSGKLVESFDDLQFDERNPDYFFDTINRRSRYVVALDPVFETATFDFKTPAKPNAATPVHVDVVAAGVDVADRAGTKVFTLLPAEGIDVTGLSVDILNESSKTNFGLDISQNGLQESFRNLTLDPDSDDYLPDALITQSRFVRVRPINPLSGQAKVPRGIPVTPFTGGESPSVDDYGKAIERLSEDTRIDLVLASIEPKRTAADVQQIHQALLSHAVTSADAGAPRIAFGSITAEEAKEVKLIKDHASHVRNRRFVLVAPPHAEGAVAGMIGRMNPQDAPTYKTVPLFDIEPARFSESKLNILLGSTVNLLVVQNREGRGVIVLKGIDTTGDQISVTRVADAAIRETKAISENFIGQLNSDDARVALRQQLISTFIRMERQGAIVPSTDGKDPSFMVDVYSTQQDFAQGIVNVAIAVRPVRSIDYIYATIRVKN